MKPPCRGPSSRPKVEEPSGCLPAPAARAGARERLARTSEWPVSRRSQAGCSCFRRFFHGKFCSGLIPCPVRGPWTWARCQEEGAERPVWKPSSPRSGQSAELGEGVPGPADKKFLSRDCGQASTSDQRLARLAQGPAVASTGHRARRSCRGATGGREISAVPRGTRRFQWGEGGGDRRQVTDRCRSGQQGGTSAMALARCQPCHLAALGAGLRNMSTGVAGLARLCRNLAVRPQAGSLTFPSLGFPICETG